VDEANAGHYRVAREVAGKDLMSRVKTNAGGKFIPMHLKFTDVVKIVQTHKTNILVLRVEFGVNYKFLV